MEVDEWAHIFSFRGINATIAKLDDNSQNLGLKEELLGWLEKIDEQHFVIIDDDKSLNDLPADVKKHLVPHSLSILSPIITFAPFINFIVTSFIE